MTMMDNNKKTCDQIADFRDRLRFAGEGILRMTAQAMISQHMKVL
jgi:hypothetical protein